MARELEPCPFCGNEWPTITQNYYSAAWEIRCPDCDTVFRHGAGEKERIKQRIVDAWNRRVDASDTGKAAAEREDGNMKRVLDVACGSKMFYFDKNNPDVEFCDKREIDYHEYYPHRYIEIKPDTICDFTALPFSDESYKVVVFDPPHLTRAGETSWKALKYGRLSGDWREMLRKGFEECFRVLDKDGVLVFKWSEVQIPLREILPLAPYQPIFGNRSGKNNNTNWLLFMKPKTEQDHA